MKMPGYVCLFLLTMLALPLAATAELREPQYPLKTARTVYTDAMLEQARQNIEAHATAKNVAEGIIKRAEPWLEWRDEELRALIPTGDVPRAFNVGTEGCPTCGRAIYEKGGTYPWLIDLIKQFKVQCPICKAYFPDNDFKAYYEAGMPEDAELEGAYADNGWGWIGPNGEKYWFVAYANHWSLQNHVLPGIQYLAQAYLLTGDKRYAHKAAVLLDRAAEVYPGMDYHNQSRYGELTEARGGHYGGKFVNLIWATGNLHKMSCSYDAIWETLDEDAALHSLTGRSGEATRAHIEANLLEEGVEEIFNEEVRGNFGMHQRALVYTALTRQHGPTEEWFDILFNRTNCSSLQTGLTYALYNLIYRDGVPYETSPGYNLSWVNNITIVAEALKGSDWNLYDIPKMRRLYDGVLDIVNAGTFTPALGDSGNVYGGLASSASAFQAAYRAYEDPRYLAHLHQLGAAGKQSFSNFDSLLSPPIPETSAAMPPAKTRLLDGYGMAILNNPTDTVSLALYYGWKGGHGHYDRQHFQIVANGQAMMPDLGYPDFMNDYVSGIYSWSKNTIAHNTVTVDAGMQQVNHPGTVRLFSEGEFARVLDINAPETYTQTSEYRRHLVMVDLADDQAYFVDFFSVTGGEQHDYSLHGPPGAATIEGGTWRSQEQGTLAGEDIEIGELYDDPERNVPNYKGGFGGYKGSGFQHLTNVHWLESGQWSAHFSHEKDPDAQLRIRMLPESNTQIIHAEAQVSPVKHKQLLKYLIARREGSNLNSRFVSVMEPFKGEAALLSAARYDLENGATAVVVQRAKDIKEIVLYNPKQAVVSLGKYAIETDALNAVITLQAGTATRIFASEATTLTVKEQQYAQPAPCTGKVLRIAPESSTVVIELDSPLQAAVLEALPGKVVHFENAIRRTAHMISDASMAQTTLTLTLKEELLVGRAHITEVTPKLLLTDSAFIFAPCYTGAYVSNDSFSHFQAVSKANKGSLALMESLSEGHPFQADTRVWIVNVAPGDRVDIPISFQGKG